MKTFLRGVFVLLALMCVAVPASASTTYLKMIGGPGGSDHSALCYNGYLVGIGGNVGAWIDRAGVICAQWDAASQSFQSDSGYREKFGTSTGGAFQSAQCPANTVVAGMDGGAAVDDDNHPKFVQNLSVHCTTPRSPRAARGTRTLSSDHAAGMYFATEGCPDGQVAVGLAARDGDYVDALGLICGDEPAAAAQPRFPHDKIVKVFTAESLTPSGAWHTTEGNARFVAQGDNRFRANYANNYGNLEMTLARGREWSGYWKQANADHRCDTPRDDTYFWGTADFVFDAAGRHFDGRYAYCDETVSKPWSGDRIE